MKFPFNPLKRAEEVEKLVMKDLKRKYYRFRAAPYYGGIATADAIGCCFLCAYCWNYFRNLKPEKFGKFYSPEEVASKLLKILEKNNFNKARITGTEPILGEKSLQHCLEVMKIIKEKRPETLFILETNGLILGIKEELIKKLKGYNLIVRISIKGYNPESFEKISGAKKEYFYYPFIALKNLQKEGIEAWPAIMFDMFEEKGEKQLRKILKEYNYEGEIEREYLERYPFVLENLKKRKVEVANIE